MKQKCTSRCKLYYFITRKDFNKAPQDLLTYIVKVYPSGNETSLENIILNFKGSHKNGIFMRNSILTEFLQLLGTCIPISLKCWSTCTGRLRATFHKLFYEKHRIQYHLPSCSINMCVDE